MAAPIPPIGAGGAAGIGAAGADRFPGVRGVGGGPNFGDTLRKGLEEVSAAEHNADRVAQQIATGGPAEIHDLMIATTKASLSVDLLVQVRNKAVEAYQEIMRMQV